MSKIGLGIGRMLGVAASLAMAVAIATPAMAQDTFRFGIGDAVDRIAGLVRTGPGQGRGMGCRGH